MLEHGGRLRQAAARWSIPLDKWLDLSTGIAPWSYPVSISDGAWQRLPEDDDELVAIAAAYYGHPAPLPLPGSQAAIQWLPRLIAPGRVLLPRPTYGEYAPAWQAAGHTVTEFDAGNIESIGDADVLMLCNPNNPTAATLDRDAMLALAARQGASGGWLVVDEAFADADPGVSLASLAGSHFPKLVVLRSLGKFFGLAGARVGFLCAAETVSRRMAEALGPWALAYPSRVAAMQALGDPAWHGEQVRRLTAASARLGDLLAANGLASRAGGLLFHYAATPHAARIAEHCAQHGILLRTFAQPPALRFGLPGKDADWKRLAEALGTWSRS
jgi:cobalamin biosynthetic protein CobC